jgi:hypothetical protein
VGNSLPVLVEQIRHVHYRRFVIPLIDLAHIIGTACLLVLLQVGSLPAHLLQLCALPPYLLIRLQQRRLLTIGHELVVLMRCEQLLRRFYRRRAAGDLTRVADQELSSKLWNFAVVSWTQLKEFELGEI